jgi:hypothetical protein
VTAVDVQAIDAKMAGSDTNVRRLPAMYYNSDSSIFEDEDSSVCGVVYITSEGGAYQPKSSQTKVLQQSEPYARTWQEKCSSKRILLAVACTVGAVLLLALGIGIAVGGKMCSAEATAAAATHYWDLYCISTCIACTCMSMQQTTQIA